MKVGDRIIVLADEVIGSPESEATVTQVHNDYVMVICDDDPDQMEGPVTYDGKIIMELS